MRIGVPREVMNRENRVSATPAVAHELVVHGHEVLVETGAGLGSSITDDEFAAAGATIIARAEDIWADADMIIKVKEPLPSEYPLLREGQVLFTYLHAAASEKLTTALVDSKITAFAYETVELANGGLPLLAPMSEIAGRLAIQEGAHALLKSRGGRGVLMGGVPGTTAAQVLIIGAGSAGINAAMMAIGMHANVVIMDRDLQRLREADHLFQGRVQTKSSNRFELLELAQRSDLVIGAVLVHGARAAKLLSAQDVEGMRSGAVLVDISIDQGGCFEPSHPTNHDDPTFEAYGCVFYCVNNMPGAVPLTATSALTSATLPYIVELADNGWKSACQRDPALGLGLNFHAGEIVYPAVADAFSLPHRPLAELLGR